MTFLLEWDDATLTFEVTPNHSLRAMVVFTTVLLAMVWSLAIERFVVFDGDGT